MGATAERAGRHTLKAVVLVLRTLHIQQMKWKEPWEIWSLWQLQLQQTCEFETTTKVEAVRWVYSVSYWEL